MSNVQKKLKELSADKKRDLLKQLLRKKASASKSQHALSFNQRAIWFLQNLDPNSPAYNVGIALHICSSVNVELLKKTLQTLMDRHATLRSTFSLDSGKLQQTVQGFREVPFSQENASDWCEDTLRAEVVKAYRKPFDLENGPVLRTRLFTKSDSDHVLLFIMHHIAVDGWSFWLLLDEFRQLYEGGINGAQVRLSPVEKQYGDYVQWQSEMLAGPVGQSLEDYWRKQLAGSTTMLDLPTDRQRPAVQSMNGATLDFVLDNACVQNLRILAQEEGATLYAVLLAAFQLLLHRYSGQNDILVGSPMFGRNRPEFAKTVGCFMNPVLLRTDFEGNPTFKELLTRVRQTVLGAFEHQDYPLHVLAEKIWPNRDASRATIYQAEFILQKPQESGELGSLFVSGKDNGRVNLGGLEVELFPFPLEEGQVDITLEAIDTGAALPCQLKYNTDIFDESTAERMVAHFTTIVESILADPGQRVAEVEILSEAERLQFEKEGKGIEAPWPDKPTGCVHHWFEAQAEKTPEALALYFETADGRKELSYGELNAQANQLARHLRGQGIEREVKVGLCMNRSAEMIISMLAVLKAGGAYVAVDSAYPDERVAYIMADAQARVILTQESMTGRFSALNARILAVDASWKDIATQPQSNLENEVAPDDLAYIIYTSGSTGKPKGVMIGHHSLASYTNTAADEFEIGATDRVLQFASISFDTSAEEIFPCLTRGAALILRTDSMLDTTEGFLQKCREWQLTILDLPTAYWHELTANIKSENLTLPEAIRVVIIGGEKALPERLQTWQQVSADHVRLVNTYGPTEGTIVSTMCDLAGPRKIEITSKELPIGRAIRHVQAFVLDKNLKRSPIGVPGELHIAGAGLARGYVNRDDLTQEMFIANPYDDGNSARLYKTGDRVRYLPDGNLEFLGRIDHQVKIRGFRVELGEIEAALNRLSGIHGSVVLCHESENGQKRLAAYLIKNPDSDLAIPQVRNALKEQLPDYMIPASFLKLDEFPLTPSGKVDRRALPEPDESDIELDSEYLAPRSEIEETLAEIWAQLLGVERVGIHDNFFELGGDSILCIQIISKANQAGIGLTTAKIFQHQTIAELAGVVSKNVSAQAEQGVVAGPVAFTPYQHWFFEQDMPEPHHWNMAILLDVREKLQQDLVQKVLEQLCLHHDSLRLSFVSDNGTWQQRMTKPEETKAFQLLHKDLSGLSDSEQQIGLEKAAAEQQAGLNLTHGPVMRVVLFELGADKSNRLLFIVHHMVIDGISLRILLEDFDRVYQQLKNGQEISLQPKTTSYKQWAELLNTYAASDALTKEINYWQYELNSEIKALPVEHPDGVNTTDSTETITVSLSADETQALLQEVPAKYNTQINDALLTAMLIAFSKWTGSSSLLFDLEGHGREDIINGVDLSRTIGCFTALFPVNLQLDSTSEDLGVQLKVVKERLRQIPERGIGYGILRYLRQNSEISKKMQAAPQADVMFNYLGQFDQVLPKGSPFSMLPGPVGPVRSPKEKRRYALEILGAIVEGKLMIAWTFSRNIHAATSIEALSENFIAVLRNIIIHCQAVETGGFTPSDFPGANLDQEALDSFLAKISS